MRTAIISITKNGARLAVQIGNDLGADVFVKDEFISELTKAQSSISIKRVGHGFSQFVGEVFEVYEALVFIMACGIVVRTIAPYIKHKTKDPAVVVLDEAGRYSISLLSGHIGGANSLAQKIAAITVGTAVITTSTDVNGVLSFDVLAKENGCAIENIEDLKYISGELVNGGRIDLYSDLKINGDTEGYIKVCENPLDINSRYSVVVSSRTDLNIKSERVLYIRPKNLVIGIGCRRGIPVYQISQAIEDFMKTNKKSMESIRCVATIDLKEDEEGINEFCRLQGVKLLVIHREEVKKIAGIFTTSEFVRERTGVGSVAEPCAVIGSINGSLVCKKTVYSGITLALVEEEKVFKI